MTKLDEMIRDMEESYSKWCNEMSTMDGIALVDDIIEALGFKVSDFNVCQYEAAQRLAITAMEKRDK